MQAQVTPLDGSKAIGITFTDKPVTAFGGLALFVAFAQRIGLAAKLAEALPFVLTSPNATPPHHIVLAFLAGVLAGARRFAQLAVLQADVPVRQLFGLRRFTPKAITATFEPLWMWCLDRLPARSTGYTLDLDPSVFERAGTQEGALKGYHPRTRGRPSHHPLFAVLAEARCMAHVWLRSGNPASARGAIAFLAEVLALVAGRVQVTLVRADSGFFDEAILVALEAAALPYAVAARFTSLLQAGVSGLTFRPFAPGLEVAELVFQGRRWTRARRIVVVREELAVRPAARGRELLQVPGARFHAVVDPLGPAGGGLADRHRPGRQREPGQGTHACLRGRRVLLPALLGDRGGPPLHLPPVQSGRGVPAEPGARHAADAGDPADHPLRLRGDPGGGRATPHAPAVSREALAGHIPRVPPAPAPDTRSLQCRSGNRG